MIIIKLSKAKHISSHMSNEEQLLQNSVEKSGKRTEYSQNKSTGLNVVFLLLANY